jgi:hypothetical protein
MSHREIRAFDYVNQPYERVRDALQADAAAIFHSATKVAEARTGALIASLTVEVKGIELSKEIFIKIGGVREEPGPKLSHATHIDLEWEAKGSPGLFPTMKADLSVYPLSATETQIDLRGHYEPPLGALGGAIDAIVGHRIAEASIHRFVTALAERLRHLPVQA